MVALIPVHPSPPSYTCSSGLLIDELTPLQLIPIAVAEVPDERGHRFVPIGEGMMAPSARSDKTPKIDDMTQVP